MTRLAAPGTPVQRIVIAGGGLTAWMAAAALALAVRRDDYTITVVGKDGEENGAIPFGPADATLPLLDAGPLFLDLDDDRSVADTGGTFTFGIALSGWSAPSATYFHPFGAVGAELGPVSFPQVVMRLRREGARLRLANYSLAALAAQAGRFARPGSDPRSALSSCDYGLHLDCEALRDTLRGVAATNGILHVAGAPAEVEHLDDGTIAAVVTSAGQRIEGDLFLDCTGVEARLSGDRAWEDWSAYLPCDRVLSARIDTPHAPLPYSHAEATAAGWIRQLPLQGGTAVAAFHCTGYAGDDEVWDSLRTSPHGSELAGQESASVRFGRRRKAWDGNCIALGAAAAMIDPVGISNLHLLRAAINRLLRLLPTERNGTAEAAEYNRQTALQLDHARDFAMLHYKLNGRHGEPLWDACRAMPVPASLDYKLRLYEGCGRVAMYDEEPLDEISWINLFDEHGVQPRHHNPIVDGYDVAELRSHVDRVREIMIGELSAMPLHAEFLSRLRNRIRSGRSR